jgi:anhydro-N-acetylmuramic acid kinase
MTTHPFFIGLMSGTSLDGVDGILTNFDGVQHAAYVPFPDTLRQELLILQSASDNEIHREALAANQLVLMYADCVRQLLKASGVAAADVCAIAAHGQTIRHLPASGYTRQINNPALLAELTGIDVIADFRSRDIAAGGQGAPLVPAFHQAVFGSASGSASGSTAQTRVVANIGGISNISILKAHGEVSGFDTGPGNVLMDGWISQHLGAAYDEDGRWAAGGSVSHALLGALLAEPFLALPPPKSTGRDLFHAEWLATKLRAFSSLNAQDVQATLAAFTVQSLADAIMLHAPDAAGLYVCGGGALNGHLMASLTKVLPMPVTSTAALGVSPNHVEALAFAWLAKRFCERLPGNLPAVTGARGSRVLGALYPA